MWIMNLHFLREGKILSNKRLIQLRFYICSFQILASTVLLSSIPNWRLVMFSDTDQITWGLFLVILRDLIGWVTSDLYCVQPAPRGCAQGLWSRRPSPLCSRPAGCKCPGTSSFWTRSQSTARCPPNCGSSQCQRSVRTENIVLN